MEDLDFPVLDAPPARTEISVQKPDAPDGVDLRKIDLKDVALAGFGPWREDVAAVTANLSTLALDLSTQTMVDAAKSLRFRLIGQPRADLRKVSKGIKSKLAQVSKDVGTEEEAAVAAYDKAEELITPQIEAREAQLAAQKAERDRIEAERVQKHKARIDIIRSYLGHAQQPGMTAERIAGGMTVLAAQTFPKSEWEEFDVQAANAQCETLEAMRVLHAQVLGREQEAARQEAIRLENERQAEINRIERERIAAELEAIRQAAAALDIQQAKIRADKERAEVEAAAAEAARKKALEAPAAVMVTYDTDTNKFAASAFQPDTEITEGQAPQQVLKAEPATADATDREAPATTSPRVGAMGAGQAADAAPIEPTRVLAALTCEGRGIYLTGYLPEAKFDEIKAIFLTATQGVTK